jgi:hypothetical protein
MKKCNLYNRTIIFSSFNVTSTETNIVVGQGSTGGNMKLDIVGQGSTGGNMKLNIVGQVYRWKYEIRYSWSRIYRRNMKLDIVGQGSTGGNMKLD